MNVLFLGMTLGVIGKVLLGFAVVLVHNKVVHEHKIDDIVIHEMRRERNIAIVGITLIVAGYLLEATALGFIGTLF